MNIRQRLVAALLRIYPVGWRNEYGCELKEILLHRPLAVSVVADVLWNGLLQRLRSLEPATVLGLVMMVLILAGLAWNIAAPRPYGVGWTALLEPSLKTLPTVTVRPLASELYVLFLVGSGCWIHLCRGGRPSRSGVAAMRICFIAGIPIMLAGVLMLFGVLDVAALSPGDTPTTFGEHGFTYTYYSPQRQPPSPLAILFAPLFRLPESWIWGTVGGSLGRWIADRKSRTAMSS